MRPWKSESHNIQGETLHQVKSVLVHSCPEFDFAPFFLAEYWRKINYVCILMLFAFLLLACGYWAEYWHLAVEYLFVIFRLNIGLKNCEYWNKYFMSEYCLVATWWEDVLRRREVQLASTRLITAATSETRGKFDLLFGFLEGSAFPPPL